MSEFQDRLTGLSRQEQADAIQRQKEYKAILAKQAADVENAEKERERIRVLADEKLKPILDEVVSRYIEPLGLAKGKAKIVQDGGTINLTWGSTHEISLGLNSEGCISLNYGGGSSDLEVNLRQADWRKKVENDILGALKSGKEIYPPPRTEGGGGVE